jgi:5-(carboxyamino)imidazole ribonucleotide mutase
MGSKSDYDIMQHSELILQELDINYDTIIVSAHRTPQRLYEFSIDAEKNGFEVIIAGAGGAAHLPGMIASFTSLPVLGVPVNSNINGLDSLLSIVQMPGGVPVATFAIGKSGAINAALFAARILALKDDTFKANLKSWISKQTDKIPLRP